MTDAEWNSISISSLLKAENDRDRTALLPYNRSTWIKQKVRETFAGRKPSKTNLYLHPRTFCMSPELTYEIHRKLLFAISSMLAFYNVRRSVGDKQKLQERLIRIPTTLLDGLFSKFTDSARGSTKYVILQAIIHVLTRERRSRAHVTQALETNLLTHIFALCLRVDEWATDTTILAVDLSMPVVKVNQLFKSLGSSVLGYPRFTKVTPLAYFYQF